MKILTNNQPKTFNMGGISGRQKDNLKFKIIFHIIIFCGVFAVAESSQAATYYVDQKDLVASDNNAGLENFPWLTIKHAVDSVSPGDMVIVKPGDYGRTLITKSGTSGNLITIKGISVPDKSLANFDEKYDPQNPKLTPGNFEHNAVTKGFVVNAGYLRIENFEITCTAGTGVDGRGAIQLKSGRNNEIINNFIHDINPNPAYYDYVGIYGYSKENYNHLVKGNQIWRTQGTGIVLSGQDWLVESNEVSHSLDNNTDSGIEVGGDSDVVRFFGTGHIIRNNYFHDNLDEEQVGDPHIDCFQTFSVYPDSQYASNILVDGNYCFDMGQMLMSEDSSEMNGGVNAIHDITFRNNIFHKTRAVAIIVTRYNDHFTFVNNIVTQSWYIGISISTNSHHATVLNNIFYNNYEDSPNDRRGQSLYDETCKDGSVWDYNIHYPDFSYPPKQPEYDVHGMYGIDPKFTNLAGNNFHLRSDSVAIDKGINLSGFGHDKDGIVRPQGAGWDIGAYEYASGGGDMTAPSVPSGLAVE